MTIADAETKASVRATRYLIIGRSGCVAQRFCDARRLAPPLTAMILSSPRPGSAGQATLNGADRPSLEQEEGGPPKPERPRGCRYTRLLFGS
jgi:hypothetical protein